MKKQYIVPAIHGHKLRIESHVLANSPILRKSINWGNQKPQYIENATTPTTEKFIFDKEQTTIEAWEDGISNI